MKSKFFLFFISLVAFIPAASYCQAGNTVPHENLVGQPHNTNLGLQDLNSIIEQCLELPELQSFINGHSSKGLGSINVVQYPIALPTDLSLSKSGRALAFLSNEEISKLKSEPYFRFRSMDYANGIANLTINYFFGESHSSMLLIQLSLEKVNADWTITNHNIKSFEL